jgi:hypothetical protein
MTLDIVFDKKLGEFVAKQKQHTTTPEARAAAWLALQLRRMETDGVFTETVTVTPELARLLLASNPANRAVYKAKVEEYAAAILRGDWDLNGEPIIVSDTGELNDGQHRLNAVVLSGVSIRSIFVFGVSRASRNTVDLGAKRTAGDILGMSGVPDSTHVAVMVKFIINYEAQMHLGTHRTPQEIAERLSKMGWEDVDNSLTHGRSVYRVFRWSIGGWAALYYLMIQRDMHAADRFFNELATGDGVVGKHNNVGALRTRLIENLAAKGKLPVTEIAALTIKAWNHRRAGVPTKVLRWTTGGATPEAFPQVQ